MKEGKSIYEESPRRVVGNSSQILTSSVFYRGKEISVKPTPQAKASDPTPINATKPEPTPAPAPVNVAVI